MSLVICIDLKLKYIPDFLPNYMLRKFAVFLIYYKIRVLCLINWFLMQKNILVQNGNREKIKVKNFMDG